MRPHTGRHANDKRQCVNGEREHKPARKADHANEKEDIEEDNGGSLRAKTMNGCAFHHHLDAPCL